MEEKQVLVSIYDNGNEFQITNSNGFGLEELKSMEQCWEDNLVFDEFSWVELILEPKFYSAQVGNYPPPNIEVPEHWEIDIVSKTKIEIVTVNGVDVEKEKLLAIFK